MNDWQKTTKELRKDIFLAGYAGGIAHLASAFSCVEIIYALYCGGVMRHRPNAPCWQDRDRFILSKGHGSLALYSVLCHAGYFGKEQLFAFSRPGTKLGGEPSLCPELGIEASTGSLGHGLSLGLGMALGAKNQDNPANIFVLIGDGECQEGSIWEAVMSAVKYNTNNLIAILDYNRIQKMDTVKAVLAIDDWESRFSSFGWDCVRVNGHDVPALIKAIKPHQSLPRLVIAETVKGKGLSLMEENPGWHWRMPNKRELKIFMSELNISPEELESCKKRI